MSISSPMLPRSLRFAALAALASAALIASQLGAPQAAIRAAADTATDPIPGIVAAQTQTRTTANTSSSVANASLMGNGDALVSTYGSGDSLGYDISKTNFWKDRTVDSSGAVSNASAMRLGQITINIAALSGASYSQQQDQYKAEVRSSFATSTTSIVERSRVLATSTNILATDITNNSSTAVQVVVQTAANTSWAAVGGTNTAGFSTDTAWATRTGPVGTGAGPTDNTFRMRAALATRILGATASITSDGAATSSSTFSVAAGATVTVATQIGSSGGDVLTNTPSDPLPAATTAIQSVTPQSLASLDTQHLAWWSTFWHASSVQLTAEPLLMRYYYGSLYVLASSNRAGKTASGMYGWIGTDTPRYSSDYTTNYNIQAPYYGVYSSNHPELAQSYYSAINAISTAHGQSYATTRGYTGTYFLTHYGPLGIQSEKGLNPDWGQRTNALEAAANYLKDWAYTRNTDTLQQSSYPFLIQVANFWDSYLVKDSNGRYVVNDSNVAEGDTAHKFNPTTALAYLREFYSGMLTASAALNVDSARQAKWQDILSNLATYSTLQYNGKTVLSFSEDNPSAEANPYPYNLYPVHPADQVGEASPLAAIARNTIATRASYWSQSNSIPEIYPAAAKVGYPATEIVAHFRDILGTMGQNNFVFQDGGGLETTGAIEAIDSMLLSSTDGTIRLFPDWTGTDASYANLRAVGAFTVSSTLTGGVVQSASITSEKAQPALVRNPWPGKDLIVKTAAGTTVATTRAAGTYTFATTAGTTYVLSPAGGVPSSAHPSLTVYKDATATSSVEVGGWGAASAVDGDPRTAMGSMGYSSSSNEFANHSESLTVDLRSPQLLSTVALTPRNDTGQLGAGYPIDLTIAVSADGSTWTTVASPTGIAQPSSATPITYAFTPQSAQYVRVTGSNLRANPGDGGRFRMQFAEVSATGAITTPKTATASTSLEASGWGIARLVNGTTTSGGGDNGWTSTGSTTVNHSENATVNLLSAQPLSAVALYPRTDGANAGYGMPVALTVAVSTDGTTWTNVASRTGLALSPNPLVVTFTSTSAQYVRVTGTDLRANPNDGGQFRMQLAEMAVLAG